MPVKRRTPKLLDYRVTPEAIAAFNLGDEIALHRSLGLKPWQPSPIGCDGVCPWPVGTAGAEFWPLAISLRQELERGLP